MTLLVVVHIFICIVLVGVILLQPGKGDAGVGFGSSSQSIFGSKGASNFLTKTTSVCAVMFLFTSFSLTRWRMLEHTSSVIKDNESVPAATSPAPAAGTPAPNAAKGAAPTTGSLDVGKAAAPAPAAVPAPAPAPAPKK